MNDAWTKCQERLSVKSITTDDRGYVSMSWSSTGSASDGMSMLDDIWETSLPASRPGKAKRGQASIEDGPNSPESRKRSRGNQSNCSENTSQNDNPRKRNLQTAQASLVRSLNGCDTLILEATQVLEMVAEDETAMSVGVLQVNKIVEKMEAKLTQQSIEVLTQGWQEGQPENRGTKCVGKMKDMLSSLKSVLVLVQSLQAKSGTEDQG